MDPNTAPVELRARLIDLQKQIDRGDFGHCALDETVSGFVNDVSDICNLFDGLDTWLCTAGFLPVDWQKHREK